MSIDHNTLLFFDSSCLIAASGSLNGGAGFLLSLCNRGFVRGAISQYVMVEAERNIQKNLKPIALMSYHQLLATVPFEIAPLPSPLPALPAINAKDMHVVAAALAISAVYLITLDKGLLNETNSVNLGLQAFTPGDFIKTILPLHVDIPSVR